MIQLNHVYKSYKQGESNIVALYDAQLRVETGEFIAIMGDSGSGKTTLMNILGCLDTPDKGEYTLNSYEVNKLNKKSLSTLRNKEIGFVFQSFYLLEGISALENVMLPLIYGGIKREEREKRALAALTSVGMETRMKHYPKQLSGGQKQRVAIARALVMNPALILADEPTGNLDSKNSNEIMKIFSAMHNNGATIVLITHDKNVAKYAQKRYCLTDGVLNAEAN